MTKEEFARHLKEKGYTVKLEDGIVMAFDVPFKEISKEAKKNGYRASYGVRYTDKKSRHKADCYEQISLF